MKVNLYVIHDRVANIYEAPVASQNDATVIRWFTRCVDNVPTMKQSPQDFALYRCGEFDGETGLIESSTELHFVATALDCLNIEQREMERNNNEDTQVGDDSPVQSGT